MPMGGCWVDLRLRLPIEGYGPRGNDDSAGRISALRCTYPLSMSMPRYSCIVLARITGAQLQTRGSGYTPQARAP